MPGERKHGAQALAMCTVGCGFRNAFLHIWGWPFRMPQRQGALDTMDLPGCGRGLLPLLLWLSFHKLANEQRDVGNVGNSEGQVYLPLFFFFYLATYSHPKLYILAPNIATVGESLRCLPSSSRKPPSLCLCGGQLLPATVYQLFISWQQFQALQKLPVFVSNTVCFWRTKIPFC